VLVKNVMFQPVVTNTIERNTLVGSLLKPVLKRITPIVGSRIIYGIDTKVLKFNFQSPHHRGSNQPYDGIWHILASK
jgi:hypothetical protein